MKVQFIGQPFLIGTTVRKMLLHGQLYNLSNEELEVIDNQHGCSYIVIPESPEAVSESDLMDMSRKELQYRCEAVGCTKTFVNKSNKATLIKRLKEE